MGQSSISIVAQNLSIRPMHESDLAQIMEIEVQSYEFPWTEAIFLDCLRVGYCCRVLVGDGKIQAYGAMSVAAAEAHILNITVRPELRRRGLGRQVLIYFINYSRRAKVDILLLEVRPSNVPAMELYFSLGFNEIGVRKDYYPAAHGREDAIILGLTLLQSLTAK